LAEKFGQGRETGSTGVWKMLLLLQFLLWLLLLLPLQQIV
jgi:hypothetical protein